MGKNLVRKVVASIIFLCAVPAVVPAGEAGAKKVRQKLRIDKNAGRATKTLKNEESGWVSADLMKDSIVFSGYDKPVNAAKEAILISNRCKYMTLKSVRLDIIYRDMMGRMLHSRTVDVSVSVPSGETRKGEFKSWDSQKTYYYHLSQKPRRAAAPYQIEIHPLAYSMENGE